MLVRHGGSQLQRRSARRLDRFHDDSDNHPSPCRASDHGVYDTARPPDHASTRDHHPEYDERAQRVRGEFGSAFVRDGRVVRDRNHG